MLSSVCPAKSGVWRRKAVNGKQLFNSQNRLLSGGTWASTAARVNGASMSRQYWVWSGGGVRLDRALSHRAHIVFVGDWDLERCVGGESSPVTWGRFHVLIVDEDEE